MINPSNDLISVLRINRCHNQVTLTPPPWVPPPPNKTTSEDLHATYTIHKLYRVSLLLHTKKLNSRPSSSLQHHDSIPSVSRPCVPRQKRNLRNASDSEECARAPKIATKSKEEEADNHKNAQEHQEARKQRFLLLIWNDGLISMNVTARQSICRPEMDPRPSPHPAGLGKAMQLESKE